MRLDNTHTNSGAQAHVCTEQTFAPMGNMAIGSIRQSARPNMPGHIDGCSCWHACPHASTPNTSPADFTACVRSTYVRARL